MVENGQLTKQERELILSQVCTWEPCVLVYVSSPKNSGKLEDLTEPLWNLFMVSLHVVCPYLVIGVSR